MTRTELLTALSAHILRGGTVSAFGVSASSDGVTDEGEAIDCERTAYDIALRFVELVGEGHAANAFKRATQ